MTVQTVLGLISFIAVQGHIWRSWRPERDAVKQRMIHLEVLKSFPLHLSYTHILVCRCGRTLVVDLFPDFPSTGI